MKITFPHMGNMYIPIKVLLDTLGIDYVLPPFGTKGQLELGIVHSPEYACLPFKTIMGDFLYGLEKGADTILFAGGRGQCRLGYYGALQTEILRGLGYEADILYMDLTNLSIKEVLTKLKPLVKNKSTLIILLGVLRALKTVFKVDRLTELAGHIRCRELEKGSVDKVMMTFHSQAQKTKGYEDIARLIKAALRGLKKIPVDREVAPIKVAVLGEMYVADHPYINFDLDKKLGNLGVEMHNKVSISHWIKEHFIKKVLFVKRKSKALKEGMKYIKTEDIGGHGIYSIGYAALCAKEGFDGIIHIYPFTCMPEIAAQYALKEVQKQYDIPMLTLIVDEMTGEAGYMTRIEAFVDMIKMKKMQ